MALRVVCLSESSGGVSILVTSFVRDAIKNGSERGFVKYRLNCLLKIDP